MNNRCLQIALSLIFVFSCLACSRGYTVSHAPKKVYEKLDFETLGDDWDNEDAKANDNVELEEEIPTVST